MIIGRCFHQRVQLSAVVISSRCRLLSVHANFKLHWQDAPTCPLVCWLTDALCPLLVSCAFSTDIAGSAEKKLTPKFVSQSLQLTPSMSIFCAHTKTGSVTKKHARALGSQPLQFAYGQVEGNMILDGVTEMEWWTGVPHQLKSCMQPSDGWF